MKYANILSRCYLSLIGIISLIIITIWVVLLLLGLVVLIVLVVKFKRSKKHSKKLLPPSDAAERLRHEPHVLDELPSKNDGSDTSREINIFDHCPREPIQDKVEIELHEPPYSLEETQGAGRLEHLSENPSVSLELQPLTSKI